MIVPVGLQSELDDKKGIGNKALLADFLDRFNWDAVQPCRRAARSIVAWCVISDGAKPLFFYSIKEY